MHKKILLAPMAGVTDKPYRQLCRELGAHECVTEMISANPDLYNSRKSKFRSDLGDEIPPRIVQIAGSEPAMMAQAAVLNIANGADMIDINMGCPAKKVCNTMAGSALLKDSLLVGRILERVVEASTVPVSLKIRTGWDKTRKNAVEIAKIAEHAGIQRLTVHGRTRACRFTGTAEHDTVARIKSEVSIEVIANGDINSAEDVLRVLQHTAADGVMIGRSAIGNPWIFSEVRSCLETGIIRGRPGYLEMLHTISRHLQDIYQHYGEYTGVRIARKHISKYCGGIAGFEAIRKHINKEDNCVRQLDYVRDFLSSAQGMRMAA
jgi:tRNA-dihydrouridine synthase B